MCACRHTQTDLGKPLLDIGEVDDETQFALPGLDALLREHHVAQQHRGMHRQRHVEFERAVVAVGIRPLVEITRLAVTTDNRS